MLPDPPEMGNEDRDFRDLEFRARMATLPVFVVAANAPGRDDPPQVQQDKAVIIAQEFAASRGAVFGGVIPAGRPARKRGRRGAA
jgi:hypothetical protein